MKRPLGTLLIAALTFGAPAIAAPRLATAAPGSEKSPEALYDEGRKAYRLGDFKVAVDRWEEAYAASDNALLLYNISLAYRGRYTITNDIGDLRRARAVLDNFIKVASADPDIDLDDAPEKLVEIDEQIAAAEKQAEENPTEPIVTTPPEQAEPKRPEPTPDPGRTMRLAGIGAMAGGGLALVAGAGVMGFFIIKSKEWNDNLQRDNGAFENAGCTGDEQSGECAQLQNNIDTWRLNGRDANTRSILAIAIGGGIGVIGLVAGGLVFNEGNKRTKLWEKQGFTSHLRLLPTRRGAVLTGRF